MKRVYGIIAVLVVLGVLALAACGVRETARLPSAKGNAISAENEESPFVWNQLLSRDAIQPIYEPKFVAADQSGYRDDELVLGIALNRQAKAYPVGLLNNREMVNDELGGLPILVTW